jgi:Tfp pilus assembly protein PilZ
MAETNRRGFPRQDEEATIQVIITPQYPKDRKDVGGLIPVKMCNKSAEGVCIETDTALHPGSNVSLKMVSPEEDHPADAHYICDGRVIWCKKVNGETSRFGVGIQILRRVVQAEVLTSRFK